MSISGLYQSITLTCQLTTGVVKYIIATHYTCHAPRSHNIHKLTDWRPDDAGASGLLVTSQLHNTGQTNSESGAHHSVLTLNT